MRLMALLAGVLLCGLAQAMEPGERLAPWTLLDQYDRPYSLDGRLRLLLVTRDMAGAKQVKAALAGRPYGYLESRQAVLVADISRMPALVSRLFAVPAMRDYPYRVLLDRESRVAPRYMADEQGVVCLWLRDGVLQARRLLVDENDLRRVLENPEAETTGP